MIPAGVRTELTVEDYLSILRRRWFWLLAPIALAAGLATALGLRSDPEYTATASVLLADSAAQEALDPGSTNTGVLTRHIENEINFAKSDATERLVTERLGMLPSQQVSITGVDSADVLEFTAISTSPEDAATWANTWAEAYVETKQIEAETSITGAVAQLEERLILLQAQRQDTRAPLDDLRDELAATISPEDQAVLQTRIERMADDLKPSLDVIDNQISQVVGSIGDLQLSGEVARSGTARVLQVASAPDTTSSTPLWRTILLGLVAGTVIGVALALAVESFDKTVTSGEDVTAVTGLAVLGSIPRPAKELPLFDLALASSAYPGSTVADGYQRVSTALQFSLVGKDVKSVLITSADQSEGKTTTSYNLAYSLAGLDHRVALVDVDFRRPRLHKVLGRPMEPGFSNHLLDGTPLEDLASYPDDVRTLAMITCGGEPPNPAEFVAMPEFKGAIDSLTVVSDLVILDGPPLLPVADSLSLARHADAVILTVLAGTTRKDHLVRAVESVRQVGGNILGVVVVGVKDAAIYGAYNYYADEGSGKRRLWPFPKSVPESMGPAGATVDSWLGRDGSYTSQTAPDEKGASDANGIVGTRTEVFPVPVPRPADPDESTSPAHSDWA